MNRKLIEELHAANQASKSQQHALEIAETAAREQLEQALRRSVMYFILYTLYFILYTARERLEQALRRRSVAHVDGGNTPPHPTPSRLLNMFLL